MFSNKRITFLIVFSLWISVISEINIPCRTTIGYYGQCLPTFLSDLCSKRYGYMTNKGTCSPDFICCHRETYASARSLNPISTEFLYDSQNFNVNRYNRVTQLPPISRLGLVAVPNPNPYVPDSCGGGSSGQSQFLKGHLMARILGGQEASENEFCWMASVFDRTSEDFIGGGALIRKQWIVTTAFVLRGRTSPSQLKVLIGNTHLEHQIHVGTSCLQYLDVVQVVIHPQYNQANSFENNIALLKLAVPADFSHPKCLCMVCLPPPNTDYTGETCTLSGFGALKENGIFPELLHKVSLQILDQASCQTFLSSIISTNVISPGQFCAGGQGGRDACQGDGGSPLVCSDDFGSRYLAGIVSSGLGCGRPGVPGLYTNIAFYLNFIESITST